MEQEIDPLTGLPKTLNVIEEIEKETTKIKVRVVKKFGRKGARLVTMISGIEDEDRAEELAKKLKKKLGCGGTVKDGVIELQGDHKRRIKQLLVEEGYPENSIDIL